MAGFLLTANTLQESCTDMLLRSTSYPYLAPSRTPRFVQRKPTYRLTTSSAKFLDEASESCVAHLSDWYFSEYHTGKTLSFVSVGVRVTGSLLVTIMARVARRR